MNLDISNGQGILDDTAHLTCYEIDADDADQGVSVINQVPDSQWLELEEVELLCIPSELISTAVVPQPPEESDDSNEQGRVDSVSIFWLPALGMIGVIRARNRKI